MSSRKNLIAAAVSTALIAGVGFAWAQTTEKTYDPTNASSSTMNNNAVGNSNTTGTNAAGTSTNSTNADLNTGAGKADMSISSTNSTTAASSTTDNADSSLAPRADRN